MRDGNVDPEAVVRRANESLAEYQRMRNWLVWPDEDFPRTSTQKPRINAILQVAQARLGAVPDEQTGSSPLSELIARIRGKSVAELGQKSELESDLNLSSLDRVELLGALEDRYQVDLSETRFAEVKTVGDLERMLHGRLPSRVPYHYPAWVQRWPITWVRLIVHYLLLRPAVFLLGWPRLRGGKTCAGFAVRCWWCAITLTMWTSALCRPRFPPASGIVWRRLREVRHWRRCALRPLDRSLLGRAYDRVRWVLGVSCSTCSPCHVKRVSGKALPLPENPSTAATASWFFPKGATPLMARFGHFARASDCWPTTWQYQSCPCGSRAL